jgi:hypothetical protein
MKRRFATGQVMAEVLVVTAALAVALFYPYLHGKSVMTLFLEALLEWFRAQSFLLSII